MRHPGSAFVLLIRPQNGLDNWIHIKNAYLMTGVTMIQ